MTPSRDSTRARWGVAPGEVVLGSVGRLDAQKAPIFALNVIAALRQKGLPVRYVWIGDGAMRSTFPRTSATPRHRRFCQTRRLAR